MIKEKKQKGTKKAEANKKNKEIKIVIDEFIDNLSIGISNLINIFEPEAIGIGGSFVYFEELILEKLKENIKEEMVVVMDLVLMVVKLIRTMLFRHLISM